MGLFNKKKNREQGTSVLSEAEIQKKLYGEFSADTHVAVGSAERIVFKEPVTLATPSQEKPASPADLFDSKRDFLVEPDLEIPVRKEPEAVQKHVPLPSFEKKKNFSPTQPVSSDAYARVYPRSSPAGVPKQDFFSRIKGYFTRGAGFVIGLWDPQKVVARRILYWGIAVLVVFLLFWSVNSLNSSRETAMKSKYKIGAERPITEDTAVAVSQETLQPAVSAPVSSRPVVITPVPVKAKASEVTSAVTNAVVKNDAFPYVIQVVTYPTQEDAQKVVDALKRERLRAFVKENIRASGRVFYVVYIGGFRTDAEAQAQLLSFRVKEIARPFQDAFVKRNA